MRREELHTSSIADVLVRSDYNIMRQAGCTKDATMQRYCFVEAAATTDPSSLYYYQLVSDRDQYSTLNKVNRPSSR